MKISASISAWMDAFALAVRTRDFPSARELFAPDVVGFGTVKERTGNLADLEFFQWVVVWPATEDFTFHEDSLTCRLSPDERMALATSQWSSYGLSTTKGRYLRTGLASIVLTRTSANSPWLAPHTHFSLSPENISPAQ